MLGRFLALVGSLTLLFSCFQSSNTSSDQISGVIVVTNGSPAARIVVYPDGDPLHPIDTIQTENGHFTYKPRSVGNYVFWADLNSTQGALARLTQNQKQIELKTEPYLWLRLNANQVNANVYFGYLGTTYKELSQIQFRVLPNQIQKWQSQLMDSIVIVSTQDSATYRINQNPAQRDRLSTGIVGEPFPSSSSTSIQPSSSSTNLPSSSSLSSSVNPTLSSMTPISSSSLLISSSSQSANTFTDSRDGKVYPLVTIGTQTWMTKNLNYIVPTEVALCPGSDPTCIYGRLYNWNTALRICPSGFHLPDTTEIKILMQNCPQTRNLSLSWNLQNMCGFNAVPAGFGTARSINSRLDTNAYYWASQRPLNSRSGSTFYFNVNHTTPVIATMDSTFYGSVRCLAN